MKKLNLPKKYLSYSQFDLWNKDKEKYRDRYYRNIKSFESKELLFGKKIAEMLEGDRKDHPVLSKIKQGTHNEYEIKVKIGGVPVLAYLDSCTPSTGKIYEYKTGHQVWNQKRVDEHKQLPFYAAAVEAKDGLYDPVIDLFWMPTVVIPGKEIIDGVEYESKDGAGASIELTGELHVFQRKLSRMDVPQIVYEIKKTAKEISEDYAEFLAKGKEDFDF